MLLDDCYEIPPEVLILFFFWVISRKKKKSNYRENVFLSANIMKQLKISSGGSVLILFAL